MARREDEADVAAFIATRGVTRCPPAAVAPIEGGLAPNAELRRHDDELAQAEAERRLKGGRPKSAPPATERPASPRLVHSTERAPARIAPAPRLDPGPRPEMAWLSLSVLYVDHRYQRELNRSRVRRIAREFKWADFQPLTVTPAQADPARREWTARFAVIDGQHRFEGAKLVQGISDVPCYIVALPDTSRQAQAFVEINKGRAPVTSIDLYRAALVAGDPWALNLKRILDAAGISVKASVDGSTKAMQTKAVTALRRMLERHGEAVLRRALGVIATAWPAEPKAFMERAILALCRMFAARPDISDTAATAWLRSTTPHGFERKVWDRAEQLGVEPAVALANLIVAQR